MNEVKRIDVEGWSASDWESYLSSLEVPLRETLLSNPTKVENLSSDLHAEGFSKLIGQNYTPELGGLCELIMSELTTLQRKIITDIYWNQKSYREIGEELGSSATAILKARGRAEAQIKKKLKEFQENENRRLRGLESHNQEAS